MPFVRDCKLTAAALRLCFVALSLTAPAAGAQQLGDDFNLEDFKIPLWNEEFNLRAAGGYKNNVTLSSVQPEGSAFVAGGFDALFYRLPTSGWLFNAFLTADETHYFSAPSVSDEQSVIAGAQLSKDLGKKWTSGVGLNYLFQNQVIDVNTVQQDPLPPSKVLGNNLTGRWFVRREFEPIWVELEASLTRQLFQPPLDDVWQTGPRLTLGHNYGRKNSNVTLSYQWAWVAFDTREDVTTEGVPIPGTHLRFQPQTVELAWRHVWDDQKHWQSTVRPGFEASQDNASGYYDYQQYRLAAEIKYQAATWLLSAQGRVAYYDYPVQTVSPTDPALRRKTVISAGLRAEKTLAKHWKIFGSYVYENSISDASYDDYSASTVSGGVDWQF